MVFCAILGTYNRNTHIFEIPSYKHVKSLTGHIGAVTVVTASPAGRYLFTASSDSTAMVWMFCVEIGLGRRAEPY